MIFSLLIKFHFNRDIKTISHIWSVLGTFGIVILMLHHVLYSNFVLASRSTQKVGSSPMVAGFRLCIDILTSVVK